MDRYQVETAAHLLKQINMRLELRTRAANEYSIKKVIDLLLVLEDEAVEDAKDAVMAVIDSYVKDFVDKKVELLARTGLKLTKHDLSVMEAEHTKRYGVLDRLGTGGTVFDLAHKARAPLMEKGPELWTNDITGETGSFREMSLAAGATASEETVKSDADDVTA